ncbi:restriction endonuclease subunit S [Gleimia europaea]|uniref:Type I restriction modification DNA specificity domain-containing protein n=1 Tax=Gleimia europaea ACS-120-V-Col10b TaxID=883069 RepID=A0A9W5RE17_9ACTO|nr:restriction endonuclease subunit S [Gleimia europaea]EPD30686.1 hypothetical protein HMPREF9238_00434 [Gleimia europaea ACS-120-V-Col10b]
MDPEYAAKLRKLLPGDLAIATTSEDEEAVAKAVAWEGTTDVAVGGDLYIYRHHFDPTYISLFFESEHFQQQKMRFITGTKVKRISDKALQKIMVPVPPKEEQTEIARKLINFDALVNDISSGLPAEIEARRKQYEYYRDKLERVKLFVCGA